MSESSTSFYEVTSFVKPILDEGLKWTDVVIAIILMTLALVTVSGNVIVLLAFVIERKLRNTFTYYIANLAITDFLVGFVAMMFYTFDTTLGYWPFGTFLCGVWIFFDYAVTFASVFTLVAISVDRYWAVMWSVHYRTNNTKKKALLIIALVWCLVLIIWLPPCIIDRRKWSEPNICWWDPSKNIEFVYFIAVVGHHVPCAVIIYCYICVFYLSHKRIKVKPGSLLSRTANTVSTNVSESVSANNPDSATGSVNPAVGGDPMSNEASMAPNPAQNPAANNKTKQNDGKDDGGRKEKKIFVTLSYILFTYLICWVPFHIIFDISFIKPELVPAKVYTFGFWLAYVNSTLNPIIYAYSNREFRKAFKRVITCKWGR